MNRLLQIIKEETIKEVVLDSHAMMRLNQRLNTMTSNNDITPREHNIINKNLETILSYEFNPKKSYGILLGVFKPNPESRLYTITNSWNPGIPFYEIFSENESDVVKDSTGDEFWAVVRKNIITTIMLRKNIQRQFAGNDREDNGGLGVQVVATNVTNLIKNEEGEKKRLQQKQPIDNKIRIDGVWWIVDSENQMVYQKNKPINKVGVDNLFDHFDEETVEKIYELLLI